MNKQIQPIELAKKTIGEKKKEYFEMGFQTAFNNNYQYPPYPDCEINEFVESYRAGLQDGYAAK